MLIIDNEQKTDELFRLPDSKIKDIYQLNLIRYGSGFEWVREVIENLFYDYTEEYIPRNYEGRKEEAEINKLPKGLVPIYARGELYRGDNIHQFGARSNRWRRKIK